MPDRPSLRSRSRPHLHARRFDVARGALLPRLARKSVANGALPAFLLGALACGALAVGALAIGRLAIGSLGVGRARMRSMDIDDLHVRRLRVGELEVAAGPVTAQRPPAP
jgi:hypothetical protein